MQLTRNLLQRNANPVAATLGCAYDSRMGQPLSGPLAGLGSALRLLREERELDIEDLAEAAGRNVSVLYKVETSENPQAASVSRHLELIGADVHDLARALDLVNGRTATRPAPPREPSEVALGTALDQLPGAPDELLREWALLYEEETIARAKRQTLLRRFEVTRR